MQPGQRVSGAMLGGSSWVKFFSLVASWDDYCVDVITITIASQGNLRLCPVSQGWVCVSIRVLAEPLWGEK